MQPLVASIRRFLLHVLPDGFHRIRHYGLFASAVRAANIARLRTLIGKPDDRSKPAAGSKGNAADDAPRCCCGGRMLIIETFTRNTVPRTWSPDIIRIDTS